MLDIASGQPGSALGLSEVRISLLRQHQAISRMSAPGCLLLTAVDEAFQAILSNGLEHPKTRFVVALVALLDQAFVNQGGHHVENFRAQIVARIAYCFRRFEGAGA